jgi:hypothetical protein
MPVLDNALLEFLDGQPLGAWLENRTLARGG